VCCAQACTASTRGRREDEDENWNGIGNGDSRGRGQLQRIAAVAAAATMVAWDPCELGTANTERKCGRLHGRGDGYFHENGNGDGRCDDNGRCRRREYGSGGDAIGASVVLVAVTLWARRARDTASSYCGYVWRRVRAQTRMLPQARERVRVRKRT
jgi:hypothetical protein